MLGSCTMAVHDLLAASRRICTCKLSKSADDTSVHREDHNEAIEQCRGASLIDHEGNC